MTTISAKLQAVLSRIETTARAAGRQPDEVALLAVSKTWPAVRIREAAAAGQRRFGENYVQEGVGKAQELQSLNLEWHFIGPLQGNKTRPVAETFDWVHSIDRLKIAERLSAQRPGGLAPLQVCIQVNVSGEETKSGVSLEQLAELARGVANLPRINLRGLMAIPAPSENAAEQRRAFRALRDAYEELKSDGYQLDTLSMGMSDDLEAVIAEGATMVRVGTAIFGERSGS